MANANDSQIVLLQTKIKEKKETLSTSRFIPFTNMVLELQGQKYNLNVCSIDDLKMVMITLNTFVLSADNLGIELPQVSGYKFKEWITDIKGKLAEKELSEEFKKLKAMESRLEDLLSEETKTALLLSEFEKSLK